MSEYGNYPRPEIIATVRSTDLSFLRACKESGADTIRIHLGKMDPQKASIMIGLVKVINGETGVHYHTGLKAVVDTSGKTPRVRQSPGMEQVIGGAESGNWFYQVDPGDLLLVVTAGTNNDEIGKLKAALLSEHPTAEAIKIIVLSYLPSFENSENLHFADGKISCSVEQTIIDNGEPRAFVLKVKTANDDRRLYWNMKIASQDRDIHSSSSPVLTQADIETLRGLTERPDEIALSFVETAAQIVEAKKMLAEIGLGEVRITAKIETLTGVDNAAEIAREADTVWVARGDLLEAVNNKWRRLLGAERSIIKAIRSVGLNYRGEMTKLIIFTHVADSQLDAAQQGKPLGDFSDGEYRLLTKEVLLADGFGLAAETMITGEKCPEIIWKFYNYIWTILQQALLGGRTRETSWL